MLRYWLLCYHLFIFFVLYFTVLAEGYARFSHWGDLLQLSHHFWGSGVGRGGVYCKLFENEISVIIIRKCFKRYGKISFFKHLCSFAEACVIILGNHLFLL